METPTASESSYRRQTWCQIVKLILMIQILEKQQYI